MASQLRVDNILPSVGTGIGIGTANGSVTITGDLSVDTNKGLTVGTGATINGSTNTITASTNGSERLRIDSNGLLRHGVISGGTYNGNISFAYNDRYPSIEFRKGGTIDGRVWKDVNSGNLLLENVTNGFIFEASNSEALRITNTGNVQIANGNLVFSTSGTGIDFSATTDAAGMTSELLDDYEEGTFDPIYRGGTTDGTPTYVTQVGRYIKIGQLVHLTIIVSGTISGAAGQLEFGGMPFIPAQDAVGTFQANNAGSYATNVGQYSAYIGSGANYMTFRGTKTDGTSHDNLSVRNVTYMRASITFRVN